MPGQSWALYIPPDNTVGVIILLIFVVGGAFSLAIFIRWIKRVNAEQQETALRRARERTRFAAEEKKRRLEEEAREKDFLARQEREFGRAAIQPALLKMPVWVEPPDAKSDRRMLAATLHTQDFYGDDRDCQDIYVTQGSRLQLHEIVECIERFWGYKGVRGPGFERLLEEHGFRLRFSLSFYNTYDRFLRHEIHVARTGPESFVAVKVELGGSAKYPIEKSLAVGSAHPEFNRGTDGSLIRK